MSQGWKKTLKKVNRIKRLRNSKNKLLMYKASRMMFYPLGWWKIFRVAKNASKVEHLMLKDTKHRIKLFPKAKKFYSKNLQVGFWKTL